MIFIKNQTAEKKKRKKEKTHKKDVESTEKRTKKPTKNTKKKKRKMRTWDLDKLYNYYLLLTLELKDRLRHADFCKSISQQKKKGGKRGLKGGKYTRKKERKKKG
jgi:hypothetical protein